MASLPASVNITSTTLSNGLAALIYENHASPTVVVEGYLPGGSLAEPAAQAGLANLTASLLRRGTAHRSFDAINQAVEMAGASFGFGCGRHVTSFDAKCLPEDTDLVFDLLAESLAGPAFAEDQFAQIQAQILTGIQERKHNPRAMAALAFREMLFGDHPYGRSLSGYEETVAGLGPDDVPAFYRRTTGPAGGIVVVVGAVQTGEILARLERTLGAWQRPEAKTPDDAPPASFPQATVSRSIAMPGKSQSDIVAGWAGIPRRHPDYLPVLLANAILGQFGMGGRLGANVREKQGMAYYAYTSVETNRDYGTWSASAGVNPANVAQTLATLNDEIERIVQEPVTADELADVQANLTGSLPLRLETNGGIASTLLDMAWYDLGLDYLLTYPAEVRAVTREDVLRVAQTYLHADRKVIAVAGPDGK